jgi:hypothetical protein
MMQEEDKIFEKQNLISEIDTYNMLINSLNKEKINKTNYENLNKKGVQELAEDLKKLKEDYNKLLVSK